MEIREFVQADGRSLFAEWFERLDVQAAAKIAVALARLEQGNLSNLKSLGGGLLEYRIDWGPGYRAYLGREGEAVIILLCGGTKRRQQDDITRARALLAEYKRRKKEGA